MKSLCVCPAWILLVIIGATALAETPQDRMVELETRLAEQQRQLAAQAEQIAQLRSQQDQAWLNEQRAEQIKTLVREVLADADTRASLMEQPLSAGHNGANFYLSSADGSFLLKVFGQIQVRYEMNIQNSSGRQGPLENDPNFIADDQRGSFGVPRTRYGFTGHVVDPSWQYLLWAGFDCSGTAILLDAQVTKSFGNGWSLTVGQFKTPYLYEYLISETRLQFIERSLIVGECSGTYTQGLMATYQNDWLRVMLSFNDGLSSLNTTWFTEDVEFAFTSRGEWKLTGDWAQYRDWQSWPGEQPLVVLGGAAHYQQQEYGTPRDEVELTAWTADASIELGGVNLFAAGLGNHFRGGEDRDLYAALLQAGCFLTDKLELIGRYEWGRSDMDDEEDLSVLSAGFNYFFSGHQVKLTTDVGYVFNTLSPTWASRALGYRTDAVGDDGQIVIRSQLQLLF